MKGKTQVDKCLFQMFIIFKTVCCMEKIFLCQQACARDDNKEASFVLFHVLHWSVTRTQLNAQRVSIGNHTVFLVQFGINLHE